MVLIKDQLITQEQYELRKAFVEHELQDPMDPLDLFQPNPVQAKVLDRTEHNILLTWGNRLGKTTILMYIAAAYAKGRLKNWADHRPCKILVMADSRLKIEGQLVPAFEKFMSEEELKEMRRTNRIRRDPCRVYEFDDGTMVYFLSAESDWTQFQGDKWGLVLWDEQPDNHQAWQQVIRGCSDLFAVNVYGFTPTKGLNFIYEEVYKRAIDPNDDDYVIIEGCTWDNCNRPVKHKYGRSKGEGHVSYEGLKRFLGTMTPLQEECFVYGKFIATEDNIHSGFSKSENIMHLDYEEIKDWIMVDGIDFGQTSDPAAIVRIAIHPECRRYHLFRSIQFERGTLIQKHCEWMKSHPEKCDFHVIDQSCGCKPEYVHRGIPLLDMHMNIASRDMAFNSAIDNYVTWTDKKGVERVERCFTIQAGEGDLKRCAEDLMMLRAKKNKVGETVGHIHHNNHLPDAASYAMHWISRNIMPDNELGKKRKYSDDFEEDDEGYLRSDAFSMDILDGGDLDAACF